MPSTPRAFARLAAACAAGLLGLGAPSVHAAVPAGATAAMAQPASASTVPPVDTTNPFLPTDANLGDCLSSLPRPECGSQARGGFAQWSVLVVLVAGLSFIGWRVVRGARRNAAAAAARSNPPAPPT